MKTIFFAVHQQFTTRYMLQTGIFPKLKQLGHRIVIITPNSSDRGFIEDFGDDNVFFETFEYEKIYPIRNTRLYQYFVKTRRFTLPSHLDLSTLKLKERFLFEKIEGKSLVKKIFQLLPLWTSYILRRSKVLRQLFKYIEHKVIPGGFHNELFEKYRPDAIVINDLGTIDISNFIMREAKSYKVPIISIILSWDNLTAKGMGAVTPDYAIAWNKNMGYELKVYHDIDPEKIYVGGIAHFDPYFRSEFPSDCQKTLSARKNHTGTKKIFFGTSSPSWFKENLNIIRLLVEANRAGKFSEPVSLIVRLHPAYLFRQKESTIDELNEIKRYCDENKDSVILNLPELKTRNYGFEFTQYDQSLMKAFLQDCDILVTQFSTLMLEAAILNKPVVNIGFDHGRKLKERTSDMAMSETHLIRVLKTGFAKTAKSEDEFISMINRYLKRPALDADPRERIREEECGVNKGISSVSIAGYIDSILS